MEDQNPTGPHQGDAGSPPPKPAGPGRSAGSRHPTRDAPSCWFAGWSVWGEPSGAGCNHCAGLPNARGVDKPYSEDSRVYSRYSFSVVVITMMMLMIIITCGTSGPPVGGAHPLGAAHHWRTSESHCLPCPAPSPPPPRAEPVSQHLAGECPEGKKEKELIFFFSTVKVNRTWM